MLYLKNKKYISVYSKYIHENQLRKISQYFVNSISSLIYQFHCQSSNCSKTEKKTYMDIKSFLIEICIIF